MWHTLIEKKENKIVNISLNHIIDKLRTPGVTSKTFVIEEDKFYIDIFYLFAKSTFSTAPELIIHGYVYFDDNDITFDIGKLDVTNTLKLGDFHIRANIAFMELDTINNNLIGTFDKIERNKEYKTAGFNKEKYIKRKCFGFSISTNICLSKQFKQWITSEKTDNNYLTDMYTRNDLRLVIKYTQIPKESFIPFDPEDLFSTYIIKTEDTTYIKINIGLFIYHSSFIKGCYDNNSNNIIDMSDVPKNIVQAFKDYVHQKKLPKCNRNILSIIYYARQYLFNFLLKDLYQVIYQKYDKEKYTWEVLNTFDKEEITDSICICGLIELTELQMYFTSILHKMMMRVDSLYLTQCHIVKMNKT